MRDDIYNEWKRNGGDVVSAFCEIAWNPCSWKERQGTIQMQAPGQQGPPPPTAMVAQPGPAPIPQEAMPV